MFENFGPKWSMQYDKLPDMRYFPNGTQSLSIKPKAMTQNKAELKAFLCLVMVSDPWPLSDEEQTHVLNIANREAAVHGFEDWVVAYHAL